MEPWLTALIVGVVGSGGTGVIVHLYHAKTARRQTELEMAFKTLVEANRQLESVLEDERAGKDAQMRRVSRLERSLEDQQTKSSERVGRLMLLEAENANLREQLGGKK